MIHEPPPAVPRRVTRGAFAVAPSCLGFGCASLGSRVGARAGLRALETAFDAGVTWFDVAPAYGAGEAESLLARFLAGRRDKVLVTTKVGLAPPARLGAMKVAYALGRPAIGALGGLRRVFRRSAATRNRHLPLDPALIESSITASLRRLGTDHVDVYALHDPEPADVERAEIVRALERVLARGQARQIGVAGRPEACSAAARLGGPYGVVQTSAAADLENAERAGIRRVAHSVFGVAGEHDRLVAALRADATKRRRLAAEGYDADPSAAARALLLDAAFARVPDGVVLVSMFGRGHLASNLAHAQAVRREAPDLLRAMLT